MTEQVTDKMINTFTQAMLLSMPEVEDHYDQVKLGLEAVFKSLSYTCISDGGYCGVGGFCNQTEVDALKAQVNCLRDALNKAKDKLSNENIYDNNIRFALQANPEQCLAEVKALAIEDAVKANTHYDRDCDGDSYSWIAPRGVKEYINKLREQVK